MLAERLVATRARMTDALAAMGEATERLDKADTDLINARNAHVARGGIPEGEAEGVRSHAGRPHRRQPGHRTEATRRTTRPRRSRRWRPRRRSWRPRPPWRVRPRLAGHVPDGTSRGSTPCSPRSTHSVPRIRRPSTCRDRYVAMATLLKNLEGNRENASLISADPRGSTPAIQQIPAVHAAFGAAPTRSTTRSRG